MVANLELRLPLSYNLNYHAWYIFPDLISKAMYGVVFADCGYGLPNNNQLADLLMNVVVTQAMVWPAHGYVHY